MRSRGANTTALIPRALRPEPCGGELERQHVLAVASRELAPPRPALSCGMGGRLRYRQRRSSPLRSCDATVTPAWSSRPPGLFAQRGFFGAGRRSWVSFWPRSRTNSVGRTSAHVGKMFASSESLAESRCCLARQRLRTRASRCSTRLTTCATSSSLGGSCRMKRALCPSALATKTPSGTMACTGAAPRAQLRCVRRPRSAGSQEDCRSADPRGPGRWPALAASAQAPRRRPQRQPWPGRRRMQPRAQAHQAR